jgi:hypothetical protein
MRPSLEVQAGRRLIGGAHIVAVDIHLTGTGRERERADLTVQTIPTV